MFVLSVLILNTRPGLAIADDVAGVRTKLNSESPTVVGQKSSFSVELLSSTFFSGAAHFDLPSVPGLIIMKVEGSPVVSSEEVDGETWSIQRHSFSVYAHRAGEFQIPSFPVRFSVAPAFGKPPEEQRLTTQAVSIEAILPPGAEGLSFLISTSKLQVEEVWNPTIPDDGKIELDIGDAITRKITLRAEEVPGMALPPIQLPDPSGLSAYPGQPVVTDKEDRGELTGQRSESTTYVCEQAGEFQLPAVAIPWWNIDSKELQKVSLPSVRIIVIQKETNADTNALSEETTLPEQKLGNSTLLVGSVIILLIGCVAWYFRNSIRRWLESERSKHKHSTSAQFAIVKRACTQNEPVAALNALMKWLETLNGDSNVATIQAFLAKQNDPRLADELDSLQRAAIDSARSWSGHQLAIELTKAVNQKNRPGVNWLEFQLLPLNPTNTKS